MFENEIDTDFQRKHLIMVEREKYLAREGKSFSIDEVKQMAINKNKRHAI